MTHIPAPASGEVIPEPTPLRKQAPVEDTEIERAYFVIDKAKITDDMLIAVQAPNPDEAIRRAAGRFSEPGATYVAVAQRSWVERPVKAQMMFLVGEDEIKRALAVYGVPDPF